MVTLNNPTEDFLDMDKMMKRLEDDSRVSYAAWQPELSSSGTPHLQMYIHYKNAVRRTTVLKLIPHSNILRRLGTVEEAIAYVTKEDTRTAGPFTHGQRPLGAGSRTDLDMVADAIREGKSHYELADAFPRSVIMHGSGILRLEQWLQKPVIRNELQVIVYHGPTGVGKTHRVLMHNEDVWVMPPPTGNRVWCDGYQRQSCVLLDDFRTDWMPSSYLLRLLDKWPMTVEFKGGSTAWVPTKIYITTDANPVDWFADQAGLSAQVLRRITKIEHIPVRP